jgi:transposase
MAPQRHELAEEQWHRIRDLLPPDQGQPGRQRRPNREMVNAMLWVLRTGAPWRDLPARYPNWKSVHTRFLRWSKRGVWKRVLDELAQDLDDELVIVDASIVRAHQDAHGGKKPAASKLDGRAAVRPPRYMLSWTVSGTRPGLSSPKGKSTT